MSPDADTVDADRTFRIAVATEYELPDYQLVGDEAAPVVVVRGLRFRMGTIRNGVPSCVVEGDYDDAIRDLLLRVDASAPRQFDEPPADLAATQEFSRRVRRAHRDVAEATVGVARWMTGRTTGGYAVGPLIDTRWSDDDGGSWHQLPAGDPPDVDMAWGPFPLDIGWWSAIAQRATKSRDPLGHELWQEAKAQHRSAPRSCLAVSIAALEAGIRAHVIAMGGREPSKSADILAVLYEAVPHLAASRWRPPPSWFKNVLNQGIAARNRLMHEGAPAPSDGELAKLLRAIRDVLYLLDFQRGHDWAESYLSFPAGEDVTVVGPTPSFVVSMAERR